MGFFLEFYNNVVNKYTYTLGGEGGCCSEYLCRKNVRTAAICWILGYLVCVTNYDVSFFMHSQNWGIMWNNRCIIYCYCDYCALTFEQTCIYSCNNLYFIVMLVSIISGISLKNIARLGLLITTPHYTTPASQRNATFTNGTINHQHLLRFSF